MTARTYGREVEFKPLAGGSSISQIIGVMTAYNGARLQEACRLFAEKITQPNVVIGWTLAGALTPAGYQHSCLIPLMQAGFIDWIISTGANLYHDIHIAQGHPMYQSGQVTWDDVKLKEEGLIRIFDLLFPEKALFEADIFFQTLVSEAPEFQGVLSTAEFHHNCGKYLTGCLRQLGIERDTLLGAAFELDIPIFTSSPGDSSIGMNLAKLQFLGKTQLRLDPLADVNETAAIVYGAKKNGGRSAVVMIGGGSPKNFALQTEPQIQQIFGLPEAGHDYFIQITDARPDTGGLSGATPGEAVTWGKIDPTQLSNTVVVYADATIALPILTAYVLSECPPRPPQRLYTRRDEFIQLLRHDATEAI